MVSHLKLRTDKIISFYKIILSECKKCIEEIKTVLTLQKLKRISHLSATLIENPINLTNHDYEGPAGLDDYSNKGINQNYKGKRHV